MSQPSNQPPNQAGSSGPPAAQPVRQGILRNASTFIRGQDATSSPRQMESIIPPLADFDDDMDDEEDDEFDEKELTADEIYQNALGGRWGEGPSKVDVVDAERDFRMLERSLTQMSRRSSTGPPEPPVIRRRSSRKQEQLEQVGLTQDEQIKQEGDFDYESHLKNKIIPGAQAKGLKNKTMGVMWKQLSVIGEGVGEQFIATTGDPFLALFNLVNPFFWVRKCTNRGPRSKTVTKTILFPMDGSCQEGEMILVLGRPGSGCSTLLRVLANDRKNYKQVTGEVTYNDLSSETVAKHYKGEVLYNQEDDFHYPTLTVRETLETAIKAKTPRARLPEMERRKDFRDIFLDVLTKMYGLTRQKETLVGNAFIRGLSGGERKRLSIAEQMATRSSINMWDGSTRGLDASSALDYVKSLRVQTNLLRRATMVSIYQASENIYDLFDKVLLLYDGRCIYFGPAELARQYFVEMGFDCPARQTTADFLTAVTDPHERKAAQGAHPNVIASMPKTPEQFEVLYKQSIIYEDTVRQMKNFETLTNSANKDEFLEATRQNKQKHVSINNPYTITYWNQIWAMTVRQVQLTKGDIASLISHYASIIIKAAVVGTCFLLLPTTSNGAFTRGGVLFFSLLFNALISQAELPQALQGRPILYKLKNYAMYRPSSFGLAQIVLDIPVVLVHILLFAVVLYFLSGLQRTAGKFFFFVLVLTLATLCMTSFFRMWGCASKTFDDATKYSGVLLLALILYSGYLIPYQAMHPWFIWIFWINPLAYAFKALMSNEMSGLRFSCDGPYLIPNGPEYTDLSHQVCTMPGARPGRDYVEGPDYLYSAFRYKVSEMWFNVLAVFLFWILFAVLTAWAMESKEFGKGGFSTNVFKRPKNGSARTAAGGRVEPDVEQGQVSNTYPSNDSTVAASNVQAQGVVPKENLAKGSVFAWEDLDYIVPYKADPSGKKQLLTKIAGLVRPGTMTALMGSSGAGKTTLLDVLAQRKSMGVVTGQIEVDGQPLRRDFQRTTGYCEQLDVHVPECTVREALQFSAHLRQSAEVSVAEKDAYVEEIIKILEMESIADALIGTTESGLGISVEERKRLTIGVELVAKPKLLFLDEPTSGLDAQASYNIMRFMRKLADQGQAILCTIHQPSSQLFAFFDDLLLLAKGGRTVFFGELGHDSTGLINYFEKNGAPKCAADANPAEYILDVVNARHSDLDWPEIWNKSPEKVQLLEDIRETRNVNGGDVVHNSSAELEYATRTGTQAKYVFSRMVKTFWRLPGYNMGRLGMLIIFGLLNGFTFFRLGNSIVDMQSRVFVVFQILVMAPLLCNTVEPRLQTERQWFFREQAGKYYSWKPFAMSICVIELPFLIFTATVFFCILYWTVGFTTDPVSTFYTYLMLQIFVVFAITLGQMIAAWTPNVQIAALLNPFIISALNLFCGVVMPYASMPKFWRSWLYWLDPYHYIVEGLVTTQLHDLDVRCRDTEFNIFEPPSGQTCIQFAGAFLQRATGYLNNENATSGCQYCQYSKGQDFYKNLNMDFAHRWRNIGITSIYLVSNFIIIILGIKFFKGNKR
ncbi:MAG: ABC-2 type transporter-domain-containing protein [Linnemannia elongata]|nr:MAG: ABC-2 type transporter-domain-containing protein [Linnemannia elongata]